MATEIVDTFITQLQQSSLIELAAVVLAVAYLLLAVKQRIECWYAAFLSTALFLYVFWEVNLYMESLLQVYYLFMAVYGWWAWQQSTDEDGGTRPVSTWSPARHLLAISVIMLATFVSGSLLADTDQRLAYVDSFTTWGAVITTIMVARKILENWIYWLVIDAVSIFLYLDRELYFTAALFAVYIIIIFFGFAAWLKDYQRQTLVKPVQHQP